MSVRALSDDPDVHPGAGYHAAVEIIAEASVEATAEFGGTGAGSSRGRQRKGEAGMDTFNQFEPRDEYNL